MSNQATEVISREVPDWRCHGLEPPIQEETCFKPCSVNCQVTQWSQWSSCQDQCRATATSVPKPTDPNPTMMALATTSTMSSFTVIMNTQSRYRRVLQSPQHGGQDCPNLIDVRPCPLQSGHSCMALFWRPKSWSKCILPDEKTCGEGIRVRELDCISAGTKVDRSDCLNDPSVMSRQIPKQHEPCSVDCVHRCVIGPWTAWSECSNDGCPSKRSRYVRVSRASELGQGGD